jgi:hypothetical protein
LTHPFSPAKLNPDGGIKFPVSSQISFLLMALPKKDPSKPKQPFGFAANVPPNDGE